MPGFRLLRRLLFAMAILAGLVVGGSAYVERQVETRVASLAKSRFGLAEDPKVDIGGGLILLNVFSGVLPRVTIEGRDVRVKPLELRTLHLALRDLSFDGSVLGSGRLAVTIGDGEAIATASEDAINDLLHERGENARVELSTGSARVRMRRSIGGRRRTIVARGEFRIRKSVLTFAPESVTVDGEKPPPAVQERAEREARISVELPQLPGDFTIEDVEVGDGILTFITTIEDQELELSK